MTANRRIALNIIATYGRSLYALVIGLVCGRWTLMALGEVDYGLLGVVGGLTAFITFLNGIMAGGVGRFYAVSVGSCKTDPEQGLEKCRAWFTTAVMIHTILPVILMAIGYPIGEWAVRNFLTIPPDRVASCVWVWRFTCISTFVGMASVPYHAMYGAKQEIAELTIYSFVTSTVNIFFMYYAVTHPGEWIVKLSAWACALSIIPSLIITYRSILKYQECRFCKAYINCWSRVKEMMTYSGWLLIGALGDLLSGQGINILVNKYFGPRFNAAMAVGNTLSSQCTTLSGSIIGAFWPAITNAYGAGEFELMRRMVYRVCKIGTICVLAFAVPLSLEVDEVLMLWLKNPPDYASGLCLCALAVAVIDKTTYGYAIAVHATGKISRYQRVVATLFLTALPLAWAFCVFGHNIYYTGVAIIVARGTCAFARLIMARKYTGLQFWYWVWHIGLPIGCIIIFSCLIGWLITYSMPPSFLRVITTTVVCETVMSIMAWFLLFEQGERNLFVKTISALIKRIGSKHE